jgi:ubiquinone/menaquinone biosynthesis C-methylase UbiE
MADQTANFSGDIPEFYDRGMGPIMFVDFAADMAGRVAAVHPKRVLETASGTGIVTRMLRDLLSSDSRITATDLNLPMLEVARSKFRAGEQVDIRYADATNLPFADEMFDAVVCQFGIMFFPNKRKSFSEAHRVLSPHGRYFFSVWDSHDCNPFARITHRVIGGFFPSDPPPFYKVPYGYNLIDPIKDELYRAGFSDLKVFVLTHQREIPEPSAFARGMIFGNPVIEQIRARGGVDPNVIVEALVKAFCDELGEHHCRTPMQTITFEAVRL